MPFDDEYSFDPVPAPPPRVDYDGEMHLSDLYAGLDRWHDTSRRDPLDERLDVVGDVIGHATFTADEVYRFCCEAPLEKDDGQYLSHAVITAIDTSTVHLPDMSGVSYVGAGSHGKDIVVHGDVGMFCGRLMRGGSVRVEGDAKAGVAAQMEAGCVEIGGDVLQTGAVGHDMVGGAVILGGDYDLEPLSGEAEAYVRAENGDLRQVWPPR